MQNSILPKIILFATSSEQYSNICPSIKQKISYVLKSQPKKMDRAKETDYLLSHK